MARSMFLRRSSAAIILLSAALLLISPGPTAAQQAEGAEQVPISAPLVREGDIAAALDAALGLGNGQDEVGAENRLSNLTIMPKNGWVADYPVTPDIAAELQQGIIAAADAGKLPFGRDEALRRLETVLVGSGLIERPYDGSAYAGAPQSGAPGYAYPDQSALYGYYAAQGPPVVTYYAPPPDYSYLYSYVDYPFWYGGYWLPGFFILRDFHRYYHNHFLSNHFVPSGAHTVFRINPTARLAGGAALSGPGRAPAAGLASARTQAGVSGPRSPAGAFGPRSPGGTFGPGRTAGAPGRRAFSQPRVFTPPRVATVAPRAGAPSAFGGGRASFFSAPRAFSGGSHSSGGFRSGGFSGGRSGSGGFHGGGRGGGGGHGGRR